MISLGNHCSHCLVWYGIRFCGENGSFWPGFPPGLKSAHCVRACLHIYGMFTSHRAAGQSRKYLPGGGIERRHPFSPLPVFLVHNWSGVLQLPGIHPEFLLEQGSRGTGVHGQESGERAVDTQCSWNQAQASEQGACRAGSSFEPAACTKLPVTTGRINVVTLFSPPAFCPCLSSCSLNSLSPWVGNPCLPEQQLFKRISLFLGDLYWSILR